MAVLYREQVVPQYGTSNTDLKNIIDLNPYDPNLFIYVVFYFIMKCNDN